LSFTDSQGNRLVEHARVVAGEWSLPAVDLSRLSGGPVDLTLASASGARLDRPGFLTIGELTPVVHPERVLPAVVRIDVPAARDYAAGSTMVFKLQTSEAVVVDTTNGSPTLRLTATPGAGSALMRSRSLTNRRLRQRPRSSAIRCPRA